MQETEKGRVVEAVQHVVFGENEEVLKLPGADSGGKSIHHMLNG